MFFFASIAQLVRLRALVRGVAAFSKAILRGWSELERRHFSAALVALPFI